MVGIAQTRLEREVLIKGLRLIVLRSTEAARLSMDFAFGVRRTSSLSSERFVELRVVMLLCLRWTPV
jgi:hypothetical protein